MRQLTKWFLAMSASAVVVAAQFAVADDPKSDQKDMGDVPAKAEPTTRPERGDRPDRPERGDRMRGWGGMRDGKGGFMQGRTPESYRDEELPDDDEWRDITEFMKANSPVRLDMYEKLSSTLGPDSRMVQMARRRIAGRYRDLQSLKDRNTEMYDFGLKQAVLEDQILGTLREIRAASNDDPLRAKLRELSGAYVSNFLDERAARLKRLREMVERETQTIERDRADIDKLVDRQMERFQSEMSRLLDFAEDPDRFRQQTSPNP